LLKNFCQSACLCGVLLWQLPFSVYAGEFAAEVKQAEIKLQGDSYEQVASM
jgi:hypothetical protein